MGLLTVTWAERPHRGLRSPLDGWIGEGEAGRGMLMDPLCVSTTWPNGSSSPAHRELKNTFSGRVSSGWKAIQSWPCCVESPCGNYPWHKVFAWILQRSWVRFPVSAEGFPQRHAIPSVFQGEPTEGSSRVRDTYPNLWSSILPGEPGFLAWLQATAWTQAPCSTYVWPRHQPSLVPPVLLVQPWTTGVQLWPAPDMTWLCGDPTRSMPWETPFGKLSGIPRSVEGTFLWISVKVDTNSSTETRAEPPVCPQNCCLDKGRWQQSSSLASDTTAIAGLPGWNPTVNGQTA